MSSTSFGSRWQLTNPPSISRWQRRHVLETGRVCSTSVAHSYCWATTPMHFRVFPAAARCFRFRCAEARHSGHTPSLLPHGRRRWRVAPDEGGRLRTTRRRQHRAPSCAPPPHPLAEQACSDLSPSRGRGESGDRLRPYPTRHRLFAAENRAPQKIYPTGLPPLLPFSLRIWEISKTSETLECADTVGGILFAGRETAKPGATEALPAEPAKRAWS